MYLIFPPALKGLANAVHNKASEDGKYAVSDVTEGLVKRPIAKNELVVTTYDLDEAENTQDVAEHRWDVLEAMSQGGVFVYFDRESLPNFYEERKDQSIEEQIEGILVSGRYTEARLKPLNKRRGKAEYVGPTFVDPLMTFVVTYDSKAEKFDIDYDERVRVILASLDDEAWVNAGFTAGRMGSTIVNFLDGFYETAIYTFDKKTSNKVNSLHHEQVKVPKTPSTVFGRTLLYNAMRKEIDDVQSPDASSQ